MSELRPDPVDDQVQKIMDQLKEKLTSCCCDSKLEPVLFTEVMLQLLISYYLILSAGGDKDQFMQSIERAYDHYSTELKKLNPGLLVCQKTEKIKKKRFSNR